MVTRMTERVIRRHAAEVLAKGVLRAGPQMAQLKRVLQDLDRSKIFTDFDLMADVLKSLDHKQGLFLDDDTVRDARQLAHRMKAIHEYMKTFVLDAVIEAGDLLAILEDHAAHPEKYMQIAASERAA